LPLTPLKTNDTQPIAPDADLKKLPKLASRAFHNHLGIDSCSRLNCPFENWASMKTSPAF
jgi:hypothetical protein